MKQELESKHDLQSVGEDADLRQWTEAGAALGRTHREVKGRGKTASRPPNRRRRIQNLVTRTAANPQGENAAWVLDNFRLIFGAEKEARTFSFRLGRYPRAAAEGENECQRVCLLAHAYLNL